MTFELFTPSHLASLAVVVGAAVLLPLWARRLGDERAARLARAIAVVLVAYRLIAIPVHAHVYNAPLISQLPFQICGILFFLCGWMLWQRSYRVYEVVYFWGIAGTLQALVTPDLRYGFPHPEFLIFFWSHGMLVFAVFYATFVFRFRPRLVSVGKAFAATLAYAALLVPINAFLGTNFMYLRAKPEGATLLDAFGPWPWYLVGAGALGLVLFTLIYLPFAPGNRRLATGPGSAVRGRDR